MTRHRRPPPNQAKPTDGEQIAKKIKYLMMSVPLLTGLASFISTGLFNVWNVDASVKKNTQNITALEGKIEKTNLALEKILKVSCVGKIKEFAKSKSREDYETVIEACTQTTSR